jgi:hypothetical protein
MTLKLTLLALAGVAASSATGAGAQTPSGQACSKAAVASAVRALRSAQAELAATRPEEDVSLVPPATSRLIERAKDRLRDYVKAQMDCAPASPGPRALQSVLVNAGGSFVHRTPTDPATAEREPYGGKLLYQVSAVPRHPGMLAVVATLGIRCGTDEMLLLYRRSGTGWEEVMVRRSEPYGEIRGGWGDLRYAVSPPDKDGSWFVATVSTTPWCTSAWQGLPYELARPGPAPERPSVFFRGKNTIYLGRDEDLAVTAERGAFEIRHNGSSLDPDVLVRRHVRRFAVTGDSVRRVQPVAETVRDFTDEWVDSPWAEAEAWSAGRPALAAAHSALQAARHKTLGGFTSIRACRKGATQVELAGHGGPGWFLLVRGPAKGPWTMERAARRPAPGCKGPDLSKREMG